MEGNNNQEDIIQLAEKINAPILADPISQMRYGFKSRLVLANYDIFLRYIDIKPNLIIRFGRKPTSKVLCRLLDDWVQKTILIDPWQQFNDDCPVFIQSYIDDYCKEQIEKIIWQSSSDWLNKILTYENFKI